MFFEKEEFEKLDLETQNKLMESEKEINKMVKKARMYKILVDITVKFNNFYSKNLFRYGVILIVLSFLNLYGIFSPEKLNSILNNIGVENITKSFQMFYIGLLIVVTSIKFSKLESREEEITFKKSLSIIMLSVLSLLPFVFFKVYLEITVNANVSEEYLRIVKKYEFIIFVLAAISATYYISKVIDWAEATLKRAYSNFLKNVSDSKDRLTIVVAFLGAIISLVALFK